MFGKPDINSIVQEAIKRSKNFPSAGVHKTEDRENNLGKILIEVSLGKQNLHGQDITQILKEIFELNNHDLEVEKVVMPYGKNTWQIHKTNTVGPELDSTKVLTPNQAELIRRGRKRLQQSKVKLLKQCKLYRVKVPQSLNKSKSCLRKKRSGKQLEEPAQSDGTIVQVNSSPGITNLLSKMYPNPYKLIDLMELPNRPKEMRNADESNGSCKVHFKTKLDLSLKESDVEQEIVTLISSSSAIIQSSNHNSANTCSSLHKTAQEPEKKVSVHKITDLKSDVVIEKLTDPGSAIPFKFTAEKAFKKPMTPEQAVLSDLQSTTCTEFKFNCDIQPLLQTSVTCSTSTDNFGKTTSLTTSEMKKMEGKISVNNKKNITDADRAMNTNEDANKYKFQLPGTEGLRKRTAKCMNSPIENAKSKKTQRQVTKTPSGRERISISSIHPLSLQKNQYCPEDSGKEKEKKKIRDGDKIKEREDGNIKLNEKPAEAQKSLIAPEKSSDESWDQSSNKNTQTCPEKPNSKRQDKQSLNTIDKHLHRLSERGVPFHCSTYGSVRQRVKGTKMTEKRKCDIRYLKLIKNMFESEEKDLQVKIDRAMNYVFGTIETTDKNHKQLLQPEKQVTQEGAQISTSEKPGEPNMKNRKPTHCQTPSKRKRTETKSKVVIIEEEVRYDNPRKENVKSEQASAESKVHTTPETVKGIEEPEKEPMVNNMTKECSAIYEEVRSQLANFEQMSSLRSPKMVSTSLETGESHVQTQKNNLTSFQQNRNSQLQCANKTIHNFRESLTPNIKKNVNGNMTDKLRTDLYVMNKNKFDMEDKSAEGLRIDIINKNAEETNRKIDFLIRHIDNSMNWLTESEKFDSSNINLLIERAKDLSDDLERNLQTCKSSGNTVPRDALDSLRLYENKNISNNRSDMLLGQSFHSVHIFPIDNGIGSVRISTDNMTMLNNDLLAARSRDYFLWKSNILHSNSVSNFVGTRNRLLSPKHSINHMRSTQGRTMLAQNDAPMQSALTEAQRDSNGLLMRHSRESGQQRPGGNDRIERDNLERVFVNANRSRSSFDSEVPELLIPSMPILFSVEGSNELGSFEENSGQSDYSNLFGYRPSTDSLKNRRKGGNSKISMSDVKMALAKEEMLLKNLVSDNSRFHLKSYGGKQDILLSSTEIAANNLPSSVSIDVVPFEESSSSVKPIVIQEITWNFYGPVIVPISRVQYRRERHFAFVTTKVRILYVARSAYFLNTVLVNRVSVVETDLKNHSSTLISLHRCSAFLRTCDSINALKKVCKYVLLPSDRSLKADSSRNTIISDEEQSAQEVNISRQVDHGSHNLREDNSAEARCASGTCELSPTRKSSEIFGGVNQHINKIGSLLHRSSKLQDMTKYSPKLTWLSSVPKPYDAQTAEENLLRKVDSETENFQNLESSANSLPSRERRSILLRNKTTSVNWKSKTDKFDGVSLPIFRYLSSETSNTSGDDDSEKASNQITDARKKRDLFPIVAKTVGSEEKSSSESNTISEEKADDDDRMLHTVESRKSGSSNQDQIHPAEESTKQLGIPDHQEECECDDDSDSTSSFKSSNDFSDISEVSDIFSKKESSGSKILNKIFMEMRLFRKSFSKRKRTRRKTAIEDKKEGNEFEDALSEVNTAYENTQLAKLKESNRKVDECIEVDSSLMKEVSLPLKHMMPRKIFKTSFRGKESVTELMIDLKDVPISEVSDISVEKRKLSSDHTKISIVISKQPPENAETEICKRNKERFMEKDSESFQSAQQMASVESSYQSLKSFDTPNFFGWKDNKDKKSENGNVDSEDDDDDYKSVASSTHSSAEEITTEKNDHDTRDIVSMQDRNLETRKLNNYSKHRFDFYKKMENRTALFNNCLRVRSKELVFNTTSRYSRDLEPLQKSLADMEVRMRNIQKNSFWTRDDYYERALRLAKMSAGYCQSCKNKTVIPEDPLGFYRKLIPRTSFRNQHSSRHGKYYFRTTSSTNSSFYSIHSNNSDVSDKYCQLNSSSSIITNSRTRNHGSRTTPIEHPGVGLPQWHQKL